MNPSLLFNLHDLIYIASNDCPVPDGYYVADENFANDGGIGCNENITRLIGY
jgi:hypothetical protein